MVERAQERGRRRKARRFSAATNGVNWRAGANLARYQPPVVDHLKAQVLIADERYAEALAALERVTEGHLVRPALLLQTADLYLCLGRVRDAQQVYEKALAIDPDNAQARIRPVPNGSAAAAISTLPHMRLWTRCRGSIMIRGPIFCWAAHWPE